MLRDYLVADVEDPRLNVQSILTRHFLIFALTGAHQDLADHELRFAAALNWLLRIAKANPDPDTLAAVRYALEHGADNAEGIDLPHHVRLTFQSLPATGDGWAIGHYLDSALAGTAFMMGEPRLPEAALNTFAAQWRRVLAGAPTSPCRVLEPACGSANDYRLLAACGLVAHLDYTGFDLSAKNVANAQSLFPGARFHVGNVFEIEADDHAYDYGFVHDLFEHLSLAGLAAAVHSLCRVTRRGLCLHFFNLDEIDEHIVRPVDDYHWNTLSLDRVLDLFAAEGFTGQTFHIGTFLRERYGCEQTHNPNAYTLLLGREDHPAGDCR